LCDVGRVAVKDFKLERGTNAQSTKYGRLCFTMSVNEWDNS